MRRLALASLCALALWVTGPAACGGSQTQPGFNSDAAADAARPDVGGVDAAKDNYTPPLPYDANTGEAGCPTHCSADLHSVIDCNNKVVKTCPPTEGCGGGGGCVPACTSAQENQSTVGCDYYAVDPATDGEANGACFAAYIANTWTGPVKLTVEYAGKALPLTNMAVIPAGSGPTLTYKPLPGGMLPAGELAILFLNDSTAGAMGDGVNCPAGTTAGVTSMPTSSEYTGILNAAFHITSSAPVVAYDIFPYGGSTGYISSATLLIPTTAWGKNYLAVDSFAMSMIALSTSQPFIQITAAEDGTKVTMSPTVAIVGGTGVSPTPAGKPITYDLNAGQVLQLKQDTELNGTPILSNKPIGVWGGNSCMNINVTDTACDSGHQQLFPINALGNEYVAVRYRPRDPAQPNEAPPWRIMGAVDGTTLTYDPPTPPAGAPTTLKSGELVMFYSAGPFTVKSQDNKHPFYLAAHMGGEFGGGEYTTGDPEHVNVMPPQEYLTDYVFMTDPTMGNTNLVLVRPKSSTGAFEDVKLDCLAAPVSGWKPVGTKGEYEYAWVDLVVSGAAQGACNNGYHTIKSTAPFGLTVWGWDQYVSYAYPAGASVQPINTVVVPPVVK